MVRAAIPVGTHWAAAHGTVCLVRSTLVVDLGKLHQLEPLGLKGAVSSSGSAHKIRTAEPIGHRAATGRTPGLLRSTSTGHAATRTGTLVRSALSALGKFDQLGLFSLYLETSSHTQKSTDQYKGSHFSTYDVSQNWDSISGQGKEICTQIRL